VPAIFQKYGFGKQQALSGEQDIVKCSLTFAGTVLLESLRNF
jgi:hypothetical protein